MFKKKSDIPVWWIPQTGNQTYAAVCPAEEILYGGNRGGGKLSPLNSTVITPYGERKIGDLKIGDYVTDPTTGGTCQVIGIYPQGEQDIYRVTTDDGASVEVGLEHLWAFKWANRNRPRKKKSIQREWSIQNLNAKVPDEHWNNLRVGTTQELIDGMKKGIEPRIPLTEPVLFSVRRRTASSPDPYTLGIFLGDGSVSSLTITSCDRKKLDTWLRNHGLRKCRSWEKFVPEYVFTSGVEYRVAFLQGLMDSDGYVDDRGRCYFTSTSYQLAQGVRKLIWGLGGKAYIREKYPTHTYLGEKKLGRTAYEVFIRLRKNSALFRLSRKKERCTDRWNGDTELMRQITDITYIGRKEAVCIKVNTVYGLYVAEDFIVTHNTDCSIGRQARGASKWGPKWNGLQFRKKYKQLAGLRRRYDELIAEGMPAERVGGDRETNYIRFKNGATVTLASIPDLKTAGDYQGGGYTEIGVEEASEYAFIAELTDRLHGALRSSAGVPSSIFMTGNPGGPGAAQLKAMFMVKPDGTPRKPKKPFKVDGISRVFIPSDLRDNKILIDSDPNYEVKLASIKDPILRAAWWEGSWEIVIGQAFTIQPRNLIDPIWPIPPHVPIIMGFDWGYGAPFSVGWYWVDQDNRLYRFAEWYGCVSLDQPNKGLRLIDKEIARGILEKERDMNLLNRQITRFAGHDCANKKPNYTTGVPGPSTVEEFISVANDPNIRATFGDVDLTLITRKPDKLDKMKQFRERMYVPDDPNTMPMMVAYSDCSHFRRVIPSLALSEINPEVLEDHQEDHIYDESALVCMSRPLGLTDHDLEKIRVKEVQRRKPKVDSLSKLAEEEYQEICKQMETDYNPGPDFHAGMGIG